MTVAVLTGADGALGRRVAALLGDDEDVDVVFHVAEPSSNGNGSSNGLTSADVVVDLGSSDYDRRAERRESATAATAESLAVAEELHASHVVFVSSAMVYGASAGNPVPLTEEQVLRPDNDFVFGRQLASAEELVEQWRREGDHRATSVLRPAVSLAEGRQSRLATALVAGLGQRFAVDDPPSQFLHLDDLAAAVALSVRERLDGVFNVAPDGWVAGDRVRALSGESPRVPLPERVRDVLGRLRWRFQRGPIPPGLRSYTQNPWVVSNGRLRAAGWKPTVTNEQVYVEGTEAPWWTMISPQRRQEGALLGGGLLIVGVAAAAAVVARRWWRRRT
jgi:nucleoside-diphosphate-sugar epimerase